MPKVKDVLVHVEVETAQKTRKCHHSKKHSIEKGEQCLVVHGGVYNSGRNYCLECAAPMLDLAQQNLKDIRAELNI